MTTGPEHYREAARLAGLVGERVRQVRDVPAREVLALAQVHATLALAAATVTGTRLAGRIAIDPNDEAGEQWAEVLGG